MGKMFIHLCLFAFLALRHVSSESIDNVKVEITKEGLVQPVGGIDAYVAKQLYPDELLTVDGVLLQVDDKTPPELKVLWKILEPNADDEDTIMKNLNGVFPFEGNRTLSMD